MKTSASFENHKINQVDHITDQISCSCETKLATPDHPSIAMAMHWNKIKNVSTLGVLEAKNFLVWLASALTPYSSRNMLLSARREHYWRMAWLSGITPVVGNWYVIVMSTCIWKFTSPLNRSLQALLITESGYGCAGFSALYRKLSLAGTWSSGASVFGLCIRALYLKGFFFVSRDPPDHDRSIQIDEYFFWWSFNVSSWLNLRWRSRLQLGHLKSFSMRLKWRNLMLWFFRRRRTSTEDNGNFTYVSRICRKSGGFEINLRAAPEFFFLDQLTTWLRLVMLVLVRLT